MAKRGKLRMLWRNVRFLMKSDLRFDLSNLSGCRCKLADLLRETKRPVIRDFEETAEALACTDVSLARFGDGEFALMDGRGISFQEADASLARRLNEVFAHPPANCEIAIPRLGWYMDPRLKAYDHDWWFRHMKERGVEIDARLDYSRTYVDTFVSQFYQAVVPEYDCAKMFSLLRRIWERRKILVVCGEGIFGGFKHDIFDNTQGVDYLYAPKKNAWRAYPAILERTKAAAKGRLVIAILGPTATVLAADLAAAGIRALDLGHLAKSYAAYMSGQATGVAESKKFYRAD